MADKAKHIDIDDFGNIENIIKKIDPSFNDLTSNMPGPVANFAQQQLSLSISQKDPKKDEKKGLFSPLQRYYVFNEGVR